MTAQAVEASDKQLVEKVQQGNKQAFDLLVLKYQHKVLSIVSRYVSDSAVRNSSGSALIASNTASLS